jgi:hypothetical protein
MSKTSQAAMDTHLLQEVTTLATAALITRTDEQIFRVTTSSEAISIDAGDGLGEQIYLASEGVARSNIQNDAELNADNLDILGVFNNTVLDETELRRGLFDFADFKIFVFNHQDTSPTMGIVKIFRGQFGEVVVTKQDTFRVTVRSLVQVYSKETGESYSKDCRADLGDIRCTVPILPSEIAVNTAYSAGDFVAVPTTPSVDDCVQVVLNFEGADGATSGVGFANIGSYIDPTVNGTAQIDTAQAPAGGDSTSSLLLDGNSDYLSWSDDPTFFLDDNPATIQCDIRLNTNGIEQQIASQWETTGNQRSWLLKINASNFLRLVTSQNGSTNDIAANGTTALTTGVDYHVALVRKNNGDFVVFLDGNIEIGPVTPAGNPFNSNTDFRIGTANAGVPVEFFDGWIDSFEFLNGFARWETAFTPPTGNKTVTPSVFIWEDFGDRVYEVTTAGTTDPCIETPNQTVGGTHVQGTATLTANHSWMRFAQVTAVDGTSPRRIFTVTELTPVSGQAVGSNRLPSSLGFPNDWFNGGAALFQSGNNSGRVLEVRDFTEGAGSQIVELISDLPFDVVVGDKLRIFPGCDKTKAVCIAKFNNAINAVAEWFVPGEDIFGQYPDAR